MPVTYFNVKPESALYKNYFIEDAETKMLKKFATNFAKAHFDSSDHEIWFGLYPCLVTTLSPKETEELGRQLCKVVFANTRYTLQKQNGDRFYRFKKNSEIYSLWKREVVKYVDEDRLYANATWKCNFPDSFSSVVELRVNDSGDLYGTHSCDHPYNSRFPDSVTVISEAEYQKAFQ